jgi:hypothetical protein
MNKFLNMFISWSGFRNSALLILKIKFQPYEQIFERVYLLIRIPNPLCS